VQQQQIEAVDAAALEAAFGRRPQIARVPVGAAQRRIGESGEALGAVALAFVEIVSDRARPSIVSASPAPYTSAVMTVSIPPPGRTIAANRSSSIASPKCM